MLVARHVGNMRMTPPQRLVTYNRDAQIGKGNIAHVESVARDTTGRKVLDAMPDTCRAARASLHPVSTRGGAGLRTGLDRGSAG